jgi:hypothetical protein
VSSGSSRAALIIAVGAMTAVTLFHDRVRQAMVLRANTLLAADRPSLERWLDVLLPFLAEDCLDGVHEVLGFEVLKLASVEVGAIAHGTCLIPNVWLSVHDHSQH